MKKEYRLIGIYTLAVILFTIWGIGKCANSCHNGSERADTVLIEKHDTVYKIIKDTVPQMKDEKVIGTVNLTGFGHFQSQNLDFLTVDTGACGQIDTLAQNSGQLCAGNDSTFDVVQRRYSDDSTYTAYVSGIKYGVYPKLDSVIVRQREISHTILEKITITKKKHWHFGLGTCAGVDVLSGKATINAGFVAMYEL